MNPIDKIHHLSAIVGDPQENIDFYREVLGLRFVKQTVNFDDEQSYHLYFSNQSVDNGTIMTFFTWKNAHPGRVGSGQVGTIAFRIPKGSSDYWKTRLAKQGVAIKETTLFQKLTIELLDVHDLSLALVEGDETTDTPDILGFHGAVLLSSNPEATVRTLSQDLGLEIAEASNEHYYFYTTGAVRHQIAVPKIPLPGGRWGIGTVHHIAWSVPTDAAQKAWRDYLYTHQYEVTEIKDRKYFHAIYFQEFGHIIFELATEGPGFTVDESLDELGQHLMLPAQFEPQRSEIVARLPKLNL